MKKLLIVFKLGFIVIAMSGLLACAKTNEEPLELRRIMQGMQHNMQEIELGISKKDWELVSQNALSIASHPAPPFLEKLRVLAYINTELGAFKKLDKNTHDTAKELGELVLMDDKRKVEAIFLQLKDSCEQCHQEFRTEFQAYFYE